MDAVTVFRAFWGLVRLDSLCKRPSMRFSPLIIILPENLKQESLQRKPTTGSIWIGELANQIAQVLQTLAEPVP